MPTDDAALKEAYLARYQALAAAGKFAWPIPDHGTARRLHRLTMPTLILWGRADGLIPLPYGEAYQRAIPGSRLEVLHGSAHFPLEEETDAALAILSAFLDGQG